MLETTVLDETVILQSHRYSPSGMEPVELAVSAEYLVSFLLNGRPYMTVACSGTDLEYLAVGHLVSEGIILSRKEVARVEIDEGTMTVNVVTVPESDVISRLFRVRTLVSGCAGSGGAECGEPLERGAVAIDPEVILASVKEFLGLSKNYRSTHGVHSAALYDTRGALRAFYDEIGRHNAVDKLLGRASADGIDPGGVMLLSTGRISSEIVTKAAVARIPAIVTRAAPTSLAVELSRRMNIILVTGVKRDSFFVHHGADDIRPRG